MIVNIQQFTPEDYSAIAEINNVFWIEEKITTDQWRDDDAKRPPHCKHARWVAEVDHQVVGLSEYDQLPQRYHPDKYWLRVEVLPAFQRRGIGSALYDTVIDAVTQLNPWLVRFALREDMTASLCFLRQRGFAEEWRSYESQLDVTRFDPARFDGIVERLSARGIAIQPYAELADDGERDRALYELFEDTRTDTSFDEPLTRLEYSYWRDAFLDGSRANPAGFFVATRGDEYVGLAMLGNAERGADIETRWVGVRRDLRGEGIAQALRLRIIAYARVHDHSHINTVTNSQNAAVIALNRKFGYVDQPAWVYYVKKFREQ
ncbi:MAG: GNAT family N-acetyltransferase [Anaerolineales bacterium]|nr:GNAT family N-acetyltransferase [Anaerolineales bacterium]